jgi:hypothetical protein
LLQPRHPLLGIHLRVNQRFAGLTHSANWLHFLDQISFQE